MVNSERSVFGGAGIALAHLLNCSIGALVTTLKSQQFDGVLFLSREGLILYKAFRQQYKNVSAIACRYILASRRALSVAACRDVKDLLLLAKVPFNPQPIRVFFLNRFGVDIGECYSSRIVSRHDWGIIKNTIIDNAEMLLSAAAAERKAYIDYLSTRLPNKSGKYLLVDVGYNGSIHRAFQGLFPSATFHSFYLAAFVGSRDLVQKGYIYTVFPEIRDNRLKRDFFSRNVGLIELLLMAGHGSLLSMRSSGSRGAKIVLDQPGSYGFVGAIQRFALSRLPEIALVNSPQDSCHYFENWVSNPSIQEVSEFSNAKLDDRYGGKLQRAILSESVLPSSGNIPFATACSFVANSDWRDGALRILSERIIEKPKDTKFRKIVSFYKVVKKACLSRIAFREFLTNLCSRWRGVYIKPRTVSDDVLDLINSRS